MRWSRGVLLAGAFGAMSSARAQTWSLSAKPVLTIGSEAAAPEYQFNQVSHVRRLTDGRILVTMGPDIRYFDAGGKYAAKAGGRGQGPGEFQFIQDLLVLPGDTLLVLNFRNKVWLTSDGRFIRQELIQLGPLSEGGWFSEGAVLLPNGNLLAPQYRNEAIEPPPAGLHRPKLRYSILDLRSGAVTPLVTAGGLRQVSSRGGGGGVQPFSPHAQAAIGADRVYVGDNDAMFITQFTLDGIRQRDITINDRPVRLTQKMLDDYKNATIDMIGVDVARRERFERSWSEVPKPDRLPFWGSAIVDRSGNLWVSPAYGMPGLPTEWMIFDRMGRRTATLRMPARFTPKDIGTDFVLGVMRDEFGVETIRMYTLNRQ
jgi:hypothetical protein